MRATIDTNIVLDVLMKREPFFSQSLAVMSLATEGRIEGAITANTITDIFYILRKTLDQDSLRQAIRGLMELVAVIEVNYDTCMAALNVPMSDYEDALLACCARQWRCDYIVTRNMKDFANSPVPAILPDDFLQHMDVE